MATWATADALLPLGRALTTRFTATADLVSQDYGVAPSKCEALRRSETLRRCPATPELFNPIRVAPEPERRRIVITDAAITPRSDFSVPITPVQLHAAKVQGLWEIVRGEATFFVPEIQDPPRPRRIWTRELLHQHSCRVASASVRELSHCAAYTREGQLLDASNPRAHPTTL